MKKLLLMISVLALLISCSDITSTYVLSSESGAEVYLLSNKKSVVIDISEESLDELESLSGLSRTDMLAKLFPSPEVFIDIEGEDFLERKRLLLLLEGASSSVNTAEAYGESRKELKNSEYMTKLDSLSDGFDSIILKKAAGDADRIRRYDLGKVLSGEYDWERAETFIQDWAKAILR